jgi:hypothetical protein
MDFIVGLPKSSNKFFIMVVVDRISRYAHFCDLQHPFTASTMLRTKYQYSIEKPQNKYSTP